ncbi:MAG: ABC transporter ATP-binding protein [Lachnospiraceae bacterium]|nr:ABC transporter ATP-binding protein [Lachnospiraceae bacterium]MDD3616838.1 ABC transporter ATP-binding protein [Lachnospiraceae bacterium]
MDMENNKGHECLECKNLSFSYEESHPVLKNLTFHVHQHETVGLIGANGVGKSTLLRILVGLETNYQGEVTIKGLPVIKKNLADVRAKIGYVFQDSDNQMFMSTVYEDVAFAPKNYGLSPAEVKERSEHALDMIGISHLRDKKTYRMSGGEKKMAAIATILAMEPDIMLMDEPTIALDPKNRRNLIRVLNSLDRGKLIASHDLDMVLETCSRVLLLSHGEIVEYGPAEEILRNKELLEANGLELPYCLAGYRGRQLT